MDSPGHVDEIAHVEKLEDPESVEPKKYRANDKAGGVEGEDKGCRILKADLIFRVGVG
ncbi:MAG: hypothetical protein WCG06_01570 [Candidatus Omnitrophota bacterium]